MNSLFLFVDTKRKSLGKKKSVMPYGQFFFFFASVFLFLSKKKKKAANDAAAGVQILPTPNPFLFVNTKRKAFTEKKSVGFAEQEKTFTKKEKSGFAGLKTRLLKTLSIKLLGAKWRQKYSSTESRS